MRQFFRYLAVALTVLWFGPALAADPVYLPGSRLGLVPLIGLSPAKSFVGFETEDHSVKVLVTELPAAAYREVEATFRKHPEGANGIKPETIATSAGEAFYTVESAKDGTASVRRYSMIVSGGTFSGFIAVQVPESASKIYTDDAIRTMFASAAVRKDVPDEEQLGTLPFKVTERGDFKFVRTLTPGAAVMLADADETAGVETAPFVVLSLVGSVPERQDDRVRFAQQAAALIPGLREGRITMSEPLRIEGAPGYETRIDALSGKDGTPVTVVQWLRFGSGGTAMRVIGSAPRDQWQAAFTRFRAVRDGVRPR
ncbi:MAG TPA: hypothetical protein VN130_12125 [Xanthobacteraceae bacterium]|jgi:hypothetical protein|nr:hypothetical protein [Xanthobacteraceae bacterium]